MVTVEETRRDDLLATSAFARRAVRERMFRLKLRAAQGPTVHERPVSPIFVIGCPRSGTSLLFAALKEHEGVGSLSGEGHALWNAYQHPRDKGWSSDRASAEDIRHGEASFLYAAIAGIAGPHRFLDKTPKNILRIPYLARLFPDARFVILKRDGRATVSSLVEGWKNRRGISYRLPEPLDLSDYRGRYWSYILPPGWRRWTHSSIVEVAAAQYVQSNEIALEDEKDVTAGTVVSVAYEDLTRDPVREMRRILEGLELPASEPVQRFVAGLESHHVGSISSPAPEKWRRRRSEIESVGAIVGPTMERLGYTWDR